MHGALKGKLYISSIVNAAGYILSVVVKFYYDHTTVICGWRIYLRLYGLNIPSIYPIVFAYL